MAKAEVIVFTPTHEEYRLLAGGLSEGDFDNFTVRVVETGPGLINTAARAGAVLEAWREARDKPYLIIGAGICGSLNLKLRAGDAVCSVASVLGDWAMETDHARTYGFYGEAVYKTLGGTAADEIALAGQNPQALELQKRLTAKGFLSGRLFSSDTFVTGLTAKLERGRRFGCLGADMESGALAWVAEGLKLPWLNIRVLTDTLDRELKAADDPERDVRELLPLKLLVALSTLDALPPPSSCSSCSNPCSTYKF